MRYLFARRHYALRNPEPSATNRGICRSRISRAAYGLGTRWFARHVLLDRWFLHAGRPALT
jgi:hypothetical protein